MSELLPQTRGLAQSLGLTLEMSPSIKEIDELLRQVAESLRDFRPAFRRISSEVLLPSIRNAFGSKTSQEGAAWAPLSAAYARRKRGGSILVGETGALEAALEREGSGGGAQRQFGKKIARIGTTLAKAAPLMWGYGSKSASSSAAIRLGKSFKTKSSGARAEMPGRQFIGWNSGMRERAAEIVVDYLQTVVDNQAALLEGKGTIV